MIRSQAGFFQPTLARVKTASGLKILARPKTRYQNPLRLPMRNGLIVGVQPGFGIRHDDVGLFTNIQQCTQCPDGEIDLNHTNIPIDANGISVTDGVVCAAAGYYSSNDSLADANAKALAAAVARFNQLVALTTIDCGSASFSNVEATFYKYCDGGPNQGVPVCVTVDAGVFTSLISQADADAKASNAANAVLFGLQAGPCCNPGSQTRIQDFIWSVSKEDASNGGAPGTTATFSGNPTGTETATLDMVPAVSGSPRGCSVSALAAYCNPWPAYSITVTVNYNVISLTGGATVFRMACTSQNGGHTDIQNISAIGPGSFTFPLITPHVTGADTLLISVSIAGGGSADAASITVSSITARPLVPPVILPPSCTIISTDNSPANDYFANCQVISGASGNVNGNNNNASMEPGEPTTIDGDGPLNYSVWYCWTAPASGNVTFNLNGAGFPAIAAYTGSAVGSLTLIAENSPFGNVDGFFPNARITFAAVSGTTYHIQVAAESGNSGAFTLTWS